MFVKKSANNARSAGHGAGSISTIAEGTTINGDLESDSDMRIDGNIVGNVYCRAKVVLGPSAIVQGDLHAENVDVFGTINGNLQTKDLSCLKANCTINGNLSTQRLQIEPNAVFNGQCKMTSGQEVVTPSKNGSVSKTSEEVAALQS